MSNLARTLRTIRHLRLSQLYWRVRYLCHNRRPILVPPVPARLAAREDFPRVLLAEHNEMGESPSSEQWVDRLEQGQFTHLNETRDLGADAIDWRLGRRDTDRLWTITLHYHAWAWRLARLVQSGGELGHRADRLLRRYLGDWITRCDPTVDGSRPLAWNAYAIATRLGWWCRAYHLLGDEHRATWGTLESAFLQSLWAQAAYLGKHLEWDLRANHLLRDAVGLAWAGRFFEGPEPIQWLRTAARLAVEQADEQVPPDGGHFERSPMYHIEIMDDFLALSVLLEDENARNRMRETWRRMAEFLVWVRHPDGQVPLLNDGGFNGARTPATMFARGRECLGIELDTSLPSGGRWFGDFGLAVWHGQPWSVFFDVGPVGVDYQPGHAHADTLTFEASYHGRRVFVDPGTYGYDDDENRRYDRATASHNTIAIDGTDSSEVWHIFRVGRRARPRDVTFECRSDGMVASAGHTGYDCLPGRPRHRRTLEVHDGGVLLITDQMDGRGRHHVAGGPLVEPGWDVRSCARGWVLSRGGMGFRVSVDTESENLILSTETAPYHPEYGCRRMARRLVWRGVLEFPCRMTVRVQPGLSE